jgi:hypothetical protein
LDRLPGKAIIATSKIIFFGGIFGVPLNQSQ